MWFLCASLFCSLCVGSLVRSSPFSWNIHIQPSTCMFYLLHPYTPDAHANTHFHHWLPFTLYGTSNAFPMVTLECTKASIPSCLISSSYFLSCASDTDVIEATIEENDLPCRIRDEDNCGEREADVEMTLRDVRKYLSVSLPLMRHVWVCKYCCIPWNYMYTFYMINTHFSRGHGFQFSSCLN